MVRLEFNKKISLLGTSIPAYQSGWEGSLINFICTTQKRVFLLRETLFCVRISIKIIISHHDELTHYLLIGRRILIPDFRFGLGLIV